MRLCMRRGTYPRRQVRTRHGLSWQVRLEPYETGATLAPTVAPVVDVQPTVQALLAYPRERDRERDREVAELRAELAQARADQIDYAARLAEAREQLALAASPGTPLGRDSEHATDDPTQTPSEVRHGRRWWQFWRM